MKEIIINQLNKVNKEDAALIIYKDTFLLEVNDFGGFDEELNFLEKVWKDEEKLFSVLQWLEDNADSRQTVCKDKPWQFEYDIKGFSIAVSFLMSGFPR